MKRGMYLFVIIGCILLVTPPSFGMNEESSGLPDPLAQLKPEIDSLARDINTQAWQKNIFKHDEDALFEWFKEQTKSTVLCQERLNTLIQFAEQHDLGNEKRISKLQKQAQQLAPAPPVQVPLPLVELPLATRASQGAHSTSDADIAPANDVPPAPVLRLVKPNPQRNGGSSKKKYKPDEVTPTVYSQKKKKPAQNRQNQQQGNVPANNQGRGVPNNGNHPQAPKPAPNPAPGPEYTISHFLTSPGCKMIGLLAFCMAASYAYLQLASDDDAQTEKPDDMVPNSTKVSIS